MAITFEKSQKGYLRPGEAIVFVIKYYITYKAKLIPIMSRHRQSLLWTKDTTLNITELTPTLSIYFRVLDNSMGEWRHL